MKTLGYLYISAAIAAFIISYFSVQSFVYKNPFVDHCMVNDLARGLFKPLPDVADESPECDENEVYHIANVTDHARLGCKSGCYCKKDYVYVKRKGCVPVEESDLTCYKHEEVACTKSECEPFCDIDMDQLCHLNRFDCRKSYHCVCKKGYIRADGGNCMPIERCPVKIYESPEYHEL